MPLNCVCERRQEKITHLLVPNSLVEGWLLVYYLDLLSFFFIYSFYNSRMTLNSY